MYRTLDAARLVATIEVLERRISERFPNAGLAAVCCELADAAGEAQARATAIAKPDWRLRALVACVLIVGFVLLVALAIVMLSGLHTSNDLFDTIQGIDSAFNIVLLMGASLFFMVRLEDRRRRSRVLSALHELRSIVHVIDMHQLTKDASSGVSASVPTPSSPVRSLSPEQLLRYLDYCSEMLSLTSKVAALYAQSYPDPVVTDAVTDLEDTATGLSQKIWQKINVIHRDLDAAVHRPRATGV